MNQQPLTTKEEVIEALRLANDVKISFNYTSGLDKPGRYTMAVELSDVSPHIRNLQGHILLDYELLEDQCDRVTSGKATRVMWVRFVQYLINMFDISRHELYDVKD